MSNLNLLELDTIKKRVVMSIDEFKKLVLKSEKWDMIQWAIDEGIDFIQSGYLNIYGDIGNFENIRNEDIERLKQLYEEREQNE